VARGRSWWASEIIAGVPELSEDALHGRWVHSHEEDAGDEMVFRPSSHPLPPSRGRMSFELRPDGSYVERSPGPTDAPEESSGSWSLDGDRLVVGDHTWTVTSAKPDRLALRR
jgi:hypothetical protein